MKEAEAGEIELGELEGHILQHMVAPMYGKLSDFPDTDLKILRSFCLCSWQLTHTRYVCDIKQDTSCMRQPVLKTCKQHAFVALVCLLMPALQIDLVMPAV